MNSYDVVVVGGGAAGLSAALVLARARRTVAVVDAGEPRNAPAAHMQGYLSRDGLPPSDLLTIGQHEVRSYGGEILTGTVVAVSRVSATAFSVSLGSGERLNARRVLITTGLRDELPDVPGLGERWGRDLLHCPYCHGYEVRDQRVGVLGGTPDAVQHALLLRQWTSDVVYFPHTDVITPEQAAQLEARAIGIVHGNVSRLVIAEDVLRGVELQDGRVVNRDVVFVRPRLVPNSDLLLSLGCTVNGGGWVTVDSVGATSIPGVWAAGNASNPRAQVITAAGEGSAAAIAINADLVNEDVANAVERHLGANSSSDVPATQPARTPPPSKHQLALMIWLCVFPTLLILNVILGDWLRTMATVPRTFVLATIAVPIVIYGLMPQLHKARGRIIAQRVTARG